MQNSCQYMLGKYFKKFKIDSHIHALKAFFPKSMNQVDVHGLLVRIFDEIVKSAQSLCKKSNDYVKLFFDKFPLRLFLTATIKVSNLTTHLLTDSLERHAK